MNQNRMPLYEALIEFKERGPLSFHVPGHKNGLNFPQEAIREFKGILSIDVTELAGLDDLHSPFECIDEAQQLLAEVYNTKRSYFLINGSTVGNLAMILSCCGEHDIVLVQRNCHKSIINGLKLAGANPIFRCGLMKLTTYQWEFVMKLLRTQLESIQMRKHLF